MMTKIQKIRLETQLKKSPRQGRALEGSFSW
jgi:hypothetical protein